jgi:hypothetical protein
MLYAVGILNKRRGRMELTRTVVIADAFAQWYEASDCAGAANFLSERSRREKIPPEGYLTELQEVWPDLSESELKEAYHLYVTGQTRDYHYSGSKGEVASALLALRRGLQDQN